jgi:hypothetical protein
MRQPERNSASLLMKMAFMGLVEELFSEYCDSLILCESISQGCECQESYAGQEHTVFTECPELYESICDRVICTEVA